MDRAKHMGHFDVEVLVHLAKWLLSTCDTRSAEGRRFGTASLKVKNGRKNVKSAPHRPIFSANRTRQRPTAVYSHADPAPNGQNGGN